MQQYGKLPLMKETDDTDDTSIEIEEETTEAWWQRHLPRIARLLWLIPFILVLDILAYSQSTYPGTDRVASCLGRARIHTSGGTAFASMYGNCLRQNLTSIAAAWRNHSPPYDRPCYFTGTWHSWRNGIVHVIDMQADGRFQATPLLKGTGTYATGRWYYEENSLRWEHPGMRVPIPDINKIIEKRPDGFTLIEVNGELSVFRTAQQQPSQCPPA